MKTKMRTEIIHLRFGNTKTRIMTIHENKIKLILETEKWMKTSTIPTNKHPIGCEAQLTWNAYLRPLFSAGDFDW